MELDIISIIILLIGLYVLCLSFEDKNEGFYFTSTPIAYNSEACGRMCDNTNGCNSWYYDDVSRQCWMNSEYRYGDLYYPYMNQTYFWAPAKYRWGRYAGYHNNSRPIISKKRRQVI